MTIVETAEERRLLDSAVRPAIWLKRSPESQNISRLGGLPWLPAELKWPTHSKTELPLHFLAQICLIELPRTPLGSREPSLPATGMLFFFADLDEEMLWSEDEAPKPHANSRVLFSLNIGSPRAAPVNLPETGHCAGEHESQRPPGVTVFPECSISAHVFDSLDESIVYRALGNNYYSSRIHELIAKRKLRSIEETLGTKASIIDVKGLSYTDRRSQPYAVLLDSHTPQLETQTQLIQHQMLGSGFFTQGVGAIWQEAGYQLLLQLDSDVGLDRNYMFCDFGSVYFWMRPDDLASSRFELAWASTEG